MIRFFVSAFCVLLLLPVINGCDSGNHGHNSESEITPEVSQQEVSDDPLVSLR